MNTTKIINNEITKINENKNKLMHHLLWYGDHVERTRNMKLTFLVRGVYHLTRIVQTLTQLDLLMGVQDSDDPNLNSWRIP